MALRQEKKTCLLFNVLCCPETFIKSSAFHFPAKKKETALIFFLKATDAKRRVNMPKRIRPTLREKKRYIAYELMSETPFHEDISKKLMLYLSRVQGIALAARSGMQSITYASARQRGIIRTTHTEVDSVKTALLLMQGRDIGTHNNCLMRLLAVSGSVSNVRTLV
jgi:ribonuclease P/MRP protein subunit POP5